MQAKIKIATVDLSTSVDMTSLRISNIINKRIDTARLIVHDTTGSIVISNWDEVIISNTGETTRYFAGYITHIEHPLIGITKTFVCRAQDYTVLTDRVIVNVSYEDKTAAYILNDLLTTYLAEIDAATYVATGKTFDKILFNRVTLRQTIDRLAKECGFDWYVDYSKNLHFFPIEQHLAPFGISDSPDGSATYAAERLRYTKESMTIINRVVVVGGDYLSDDATFYLPNNNVTTELLMPYKMRAPVGQSAIQVWHNDGNDGAPDWAADVVGTDYIHTLGGNGYTVLHNYQEKLLKFDTAPPDLNLAVKITVRYEVPVLMRVSSELSYSTYGRWFDGKIVNKNLTSRNAAKLAGKALLAESAFVRETGRFELTDRDGLIAGQRLSMVDTKRSIDGNYLINRVETTWLEGGTVCLYQISFGEYNPDLIDLLISLKESSYEVRETRVDEVLNELFERLETLGLSETTDFHSDSWDGEVSRKIAEPPDQGALCAVQHERVSLSEAPDDTENTTRLYKWG